MEPGPRPSFPTSPPLRLHSLPQSGTAPAGETRGPQQEPLIHDTYEDLVVAPHRHEAPRAVFLAKGAVLLLKGAAFPVAGAVLLLKGGILLVNGELSF